MKGYGFDVEIKSVDLTQIIPFKGFMLQARDGARNLFGSFELRDEKVVRVKPELKISGYEL